jgi:hypothetical protein
MKSNTATIPAIMVSIGSEFVAKPGVKAGQDEKQGCHGDEDEIRHGVASLTARALVSFPPRNGRCQDKTMKRIQQADEFCSRREYAAGFDPGIIKCHAKVVKKKSK